MTTLGDLIVGPALLLLGSTYPQRVRGVLANVPSAFSWQGEGATPDAPSWTLGGNPVPFVKTDMSPEMYARYQAAIRDGTPFSFRPVYEEALAHATADAVAKATIAVERISGPVMLLSSVLDGVWPSNVFAAQIVTRLEASAFPHAVTSFTYPSSGHLIQDGYQPTTLNRYLVSYNHLVMDLGGTPEGSAAANVASWPEVLSFLDAATR